MIKKIFGNEKLLSTVDWRKIMTEKEMCLLKKFDILEINKIVPYRNHPNTNLLYVFYDHDWHTVEKEDVETGYRCAIQDIKEKYIHED